jgi:anti-sigma B factor antagonist
MAPSDGPALGVQATSIDGVLVLAVRGDVDTLTAPLLAQAISNATNTWLRALIIDLIEVDFLTSAGMTVLVSAHQRLERLAVVIAEGSPISRPFEIAGLDSILRVHSTLDDALNEFLVT